MERLFSNDFLEICSVLTLTDFLEEIFPELYASKRSYRSYSMDMRYYEDLYQRMRHTINFENNKAIDVGNHVSDTIIPATTNVDRLTTFYTYGWAETGLKLFFSTYQSIDVISTFQKNTGLEIDLIICDEAHRTTGVTLAGEDESDFVKVHNNDFIKGKKRLYITAPPRIYGDESKAKANEKSALLCSMDDKEILGAKFFRLGFSEAVTLGLLTDYKVIVLAVNENFVNRALQNLFTSSSSELIFEDAVKTMGCMNGLSKRTVFGEEEYFANDPAPVRRTVAFNSSIAASKKFVALFREIQDELKFHGYDDSVVSVEMAHVDETNNALFRKDRIDWLKERTPERCCRVSSNARCLSEGIDVPALLLFTAIIQIGPKLRGSGLYLELCTVTRR